MKTEALKKTADRPSILKSLQFIALASFIMYFGKTLLVPLCFGLLLAIIAYPASKRLEKKGVPRSGAAALILCGICLIFVLLGWLLFYEIRIFFGELPHLRSRFSEIITELKQFLIGPAQIDPGSIDDFVRSFNGNLGNELVSAIGLTSSTVLMLVLTPIYSALFLVHRKTFVRFIVGLFPAEDKKNLDTVLQNSIVSYFKFIKGTFFVYCIVAVLNSAGLLALGIPHAILFGTVTAFMTIIPYLGIIVSAALPVSVALLTRDSLWYPAGVVFVFVFVQYLEANVIFPKVVGTQLNLSTWTVLVAVILGSMIWGISGMILFVPFAAILKLCSDQIEVLKPLNILMNRKEFD